MLSNNISQANIFIFEFLWQTGLQALCEQTWLSKYILCIMKMPSSIMTQYFTIRPISYISRRVWDTHWIQECDCTRKTTEIMHSLNIVDIMKDLLQLSKYSRATFCMHNIILKYLKYTISKLNIVIKELTFFFFHFGGCILYVCCRWSVEVDRGYCIKCKQNKTVLSYRIKLLLVHVS